MTEQPPPPLKPLVPKPGATSDHIAAAVFAMLAEALQAGVRAPETSSPSPAEASSPAPPAEDAEAARRRTFLEKLAKVQA